ncbi:TRAP transporter small permease [Agathobaculum sp. NTUH-O15-33]|uniref:TRAP transporter small permease n=1 Tax=Agathobaculum sp. NTUH-O15-33 TaxID=3079302 RepID=UPI0029589263|nr:TRAP transporter small permease [Agathobaculum sp. NTUH-O15-33]WNX84530.1 TRAP transporter small permease [Agathobaculum sp. NTUH-O15-33]
MPLKKKAHVGVEVFINLLPPRALKAARLLGDALTCVLFAIMLALSVKMLLQYGQTRQLTTITKLPMTLIYCCVPAGMFLSVLHGLTGLVQTIRAGKEADAA